MPDDCSTPAIVLVHGAWLGDWSWDAVGEHLRAAGHQVWIVSLKGHGRRRKESGPGVTLEDHVCDVVDVITAADLHDVVLVGHSYGGRVITQAWARVPDRVARLVYVDAHAPVEIPVAPAPTWAPDDTSASPGMIPFGGVRLDAEMFHGDTTLVEQVRARLVDHSAATIAVPWKVSLPADLPRTYVHATQEALAPFSAYAAAVRKDPAWTYIEIPGPHLLVLTHPAEVATAIVAD